MGFLPVTTIADWMQMQIQPQQQQAATTPGATLFSDLIELRDSETAENIQNWALSKTGQETPGGQALAALDAQNLNDHAGITIASISGLDSQFQHLGDDTGKLERIIGDLDKKVTGSQKDIRDHAIQLHILRQDHIRDLKQKIEQLQQKVQKLQHEGEQDRRVNTTAIQMLVGRLGMDYDQVSWLQCFPSKRSLTKACLSS